MYVTISLKKPPTPLTPNRIFITIIMVTTRRRRGEGKCVASHTGIKLRARNAAHSDGETGACAFYLVVFVGPRKAGSVTSFPEALPASQLICHIMLRAGRSPMR